MTVAKYAKDAGLKSLAQVSELTGVTRSTLYDWFETKPKLFEIVILGCVKSTEKEQS